MDSKTLGVVAGAIGFVGALAYFGKQSKSLARSTIRPFENLGPEALREEFRKPRDSRTKEQLLKNLKTSLKMYEDSPKLTSMLGDEPASVLFANILQLHQIDTPYESDLPHEMSITFGQTLYDMNRLLGTDVVREEPEVVIRLLDNLGAMAEEAHLAGSDDDHPKLKYDVMAQRLARVEGLMRQLARMPKEMRRSVIDNIVPGRDQPPRPKMSTTQIGSAADSPPPSLYQIIDFYKEFEERSRQIDAGKKK